MSGKATVIRTAGVLIAEIVTIQDQVRDQVNTLALNAAIQIGSRLHELKATVPHGEFGQLLKEQLNYSERTAQNFMRLYTEYGEGAKTQALADLGYTKALTLLALPSGEREAFVEAHNIDDLSTRELQRQIDDMKQSLKDKQAKNDELTAGLRDARAAANKALKDKLAGDAASRKAEADLIAVREELESLQHEAANAAPQALAPSPAPSTVVVEAVPDEVVQELAALKEKAASTPSEAMIRFRAAYERLVSEFEVVAQLLDRLGEETPQQEIRFRKAVYKAAEVMMRRVWDGGGENV